MDEWKRAKQMAFHQSQATSSETVTYLVNVDIYVLFRAAPPIFLCFAYGACNWGYWGLETSSARHLVNSNYTF